MGRNILRFSLSSHLLSIYDVNFRVDPHKVPRKRGFTTQSFFLTMLHLVLDGNAGYFSALLKTFTLDQGCTPPSASAFCQLRIKISYRFFKVAFERIVEKSNARVSRWKKFQVIAIDGKQFILPRTKDLVTRKFSGRKTSKYAETYMPRGYLTLAFDVLGASS